MFTSEQNTVLLVSQWYEELAKPGFTPPDNIFGIVWPILYVLMFAALVYVLIVGHRGIDIKVAIGAFAVQLILNLLWTPLFFGLKSPGLALIDVLILFNAIIVTIWAFWRISRIAAIMLWPYLLWVGFAMVLNASIWWMNS